jgi:formylglycine-generating enzyme required for sulfatase activity
MEWVADCYRPGYTDAPVDGRARLDRDCEYRVARGGAFNKPSSSMRAYVREHFVPETRLNALGFRVARDL